MADLERENAIGFVDKRRSTAAFERVTSGTDTEFGTANLDTYTTVPQMRAYLTASTGHGAGYYTTARLNMMTSNDMTAAIRNLQDVAGTK